MYAVTVQLGETGSLALREVAQPRPGEGPLVISGLAVGVWGTDAEIVNGEYGEPRVVPLRRYAEAFNRQPGAIKVILDLQEAEQ